MKGKTTAQRLDELLDYIGSLDNRGDAVSDVPDFVELRTVIAQLIEETRVKAIRDCAAELGDSGDYYLERGESRLLTRWPEARQ